MKAESSNAARQMAGTTAAPLLLCAIASWLVVPVGSRSYAAGFDCKKATSAVERQICSSPELSALDEELTGTYLAALRIVSEPEKLRKDQRSWLKQRESCFGETNPPPCVHMIDEYRARLITLHAALYADAEQCESASALEAWECSANKYAGVQRELDSLLKEMRRKLVSPDDELASEAPWEAYRKKECESRNNETGFGGGVPVNYCYITLTKLRIAELRSYHFCKEGGCPGQKD